MRALKMDVEAYLQDLGHVERYMIGNARFRIRILDRD